jgi:hypothetical protein
MASLAIDSDESSTSSDGSSWSRESSCVTSKRRRPTNTKSTTANDNNKKRKRVRKKDPDVKRPITVEPKDVLLGRGGLSNHHVGNKAYRKRILELQPLYKTLPREEKTSCSEAVVAWVKGRGGRFVKQDTKDGPYYEVTDKTARQKVSQALREDHTPGKQHNILVGLTLLTWRSTHAFLPGPPSLITEGRALKKAKQRRPPKKSIGTTIAPKKKRMKTKP